jgi:lysophospholipase L1-like esterase
VPVAAGSVTMRGVQGGVVAAVLVGVAALGLFVAPVAPTPLSSPLTRHGQYVALGDSYAAGPGIPSPIGAPLACGRSTHGYPVMFYERTQLAAFHDATCGGATIADIASAQSTRSGVNPPQLNAVTTDTTLITLTIGANDLGFADIIDHCLRPPTQTPGTGCHDYYSRDGHDVLADRLAVATAQLASMLRRISERAPHAILLVVGYPTIWPATGGGCDQAPASGDDISYLSDTFVALNQMLRDQAEAVGARYVDTATPSAGHDICQAPDLRWIEGDPPAAPALAYHPNLTGMNNIAKEVLGAGLQP